MLSKESSVCSGLLKKTILNHRCPECGGSMAEVDKFCESDNIFKWYDCQNESCNGQWLEKIPRI